MQHILDVMQNCVKYQIAIFFQDNVVICLQIRRKYIEPDRCSSGP